MAELWVEPDRERDLFHGVGGRRLAPDSADDYHVIEIKVGGFSEGYTLLDSNEREWSAGDSWAFDDNPFVGTRELKGLLVLQALLENQDIKASNNVVYTLKSPARGATRWYLVRDLGYSLGRAGFNDPRGDIDATNRPRSCGRSSTAPSGSITAASTRSCSRASPSPTCSGSASG